MKNSSKKMCAVLIALAVSTPTMANVVVGDGLGVELNLPNSYKGKEKASIAAISHYMGIKDANKIFNAPKNDINIKLNADAVTYSDYDSNLSVQKLRSNSLSEVNTNIDALVKNKPMFMVRLSDGEENLVFGAASVPKQSIKAFEYTGDNPNDITYSIPKELNVITLNTNTLYGGEYSSVKNRTFAHELGHALGAEHENQEYADYVNDAVFAGATSVTLCADGSTPLMVADAVEWAKDAIPLISGTTACPVIDDKMTGNKPAMVKYYASTQVVYNTDSEKWNEEVSARTPATIDVAVTENINTQQFDFSVTRTQNNATQSTLYIAGNGVGLKPIEFNFADGQKSQTVSVDFEQIHQLLQTSSQNLVDGKDYYDTVYAIAQTGGEVTKSIADVSAVNTQFVFTPKDKEPEPQPEPEPEPQPQPDNGGSGGGGSSSLGFLMMLAALAWYRKK